MSELERLRHTAAKLLCTLLWANVPIVAAASLLLNTGQAYLHGGTAAALAGAGSLSFYFLGFGSATRQILSVALVGVVALLVLVFSGHPWQIDQHMYFFAALAVVAILCDWRAIVIAAAAVAVHHALLNILLPSAVFPDGADFARVALHAAIVILQTAALVWLTGSLAGAFARSAQAFETANAAQFEARQLAQEQEETRARADRDRREALAGMADTFEASVKNLVRDVAAAARDMTATAQRLSAMAERSRADARAVTSESASASEQARSVAAMSESMHRGSSAIREQVARSDRTAHQAGHRARETDAVIQSLAGAAERIGSVVGLITDIADQTNLLALNATIEAARAGDAGKGFAVVASEVKALASQTARATGDIEEQVACIRSVSQQAIEAIAQIRSTIEDIGSVTSEVDRAIDGQMRESEAIVEQIGGVAEGVGKLSSRLHEIDHAAADAEQSSHSVMDAAQRLTMRSDALEAEVDTLLRRVRAG